MALSLAIAVPLLQPSSTANAVEDASAESSRSVRSCESMLLVNFADGARVTSATTVPASAAGPEHCELSVVVPDQIKVLVGLPTHDWNGRYQAMGNGGYAGVPVISAEGYLDAIADGYVVSATDTGHSGTPFSGEWAWSPTGMRYTQIQDFAHRANHQMAVKSKVLIEEYYGRRPAYSYWNGCSTGGREGLTEAMRYPDDFDGIVAGAPAINWTRFVPAELWPQLAMMEADHRLPACKLAAFAHAFRASCDPADGLTDGLFDPRACSFDPASLVGTATDCGTITKKDADVMAEIWRGPHRRTGEKLWYGLYPGTDVGSAPPLTLGHSITNDDGSIGDGVPMPLTSDWFKWWLHKDPTWDWHLQTQAQFEADFDRSVSEWADVLATNNADLSAFKSSGGKVVIWHGFNDPLIFAQGSVDYYKRVVDRMRGLRKTQDFARLFLAPNVGHCANATAEFENGPTPTDPLAAVVGWVEHGNAPETLPAQLPPNSGVNNTNDVMTRPLCAFPTTATYDGTGSTYEAANFRCKATSWGDQLEADPDLLPIGN